MKMAEKQGSFEALQHRYEMLKISRSQIAEMFDNMGVELPLTPNDQPKFKPAKK
jgi:hypothetical protein